MCVCAADTHFWCFGVKIQDSTIFIEIIMAVMLSCFMQRRSMIWCDCVMKKRILSDTIAVGMFINYLNQQNHLSLPSKNDPYEHFLLSLLKDKAGNFGNTDNKSHVLRKQQTNNELISVNSFIYRLF